MTLFIAAFDGRSVTDVLLAAVLGLVAFALLTASVILLRRPVTFSRRATLTADQEIKITIDDSFTQSVCDYSVGFLRFNREGKIETATPAGTGTFAKVGKVYGILTAGHVLKPMGTKEVIGLVRFPSVQPPLQNFRLDLDHTERKVTWNGKDCDAPDIAFLKIPEIDGRNLEAAGAVFYNLGLAREFSARKPEHRMSKCYVVVGVVGEWTEDVSGSLTKGKKINIGGLFGAAKNLREFKESNTDLVEVEIDHAAGPKIPRSYGGVSGGALWELHVELDKQLKPVQVNKRLHGVAFRESDDRRRITSNAAPSIDTITKQIEAKCPNGS